MLLFNGQKTYALGDSVSNFNTSNVTIQPIDTFTTWWDFIFQYI